VPTRGRRPRTRRGARRSAAQRLAAERSDEAGEVRPVLPEVGVHPASQRVVDDADTKVASAAPASGSGPPKLTTKPPCEPMQGRGTGPRRSGLFDLSLAPTSEIVRVRSPCRGPRRRLDGEATGVRRIAGCGPWVGNEYLVFHEQRLTVARPCRTLSPKDPAVPSRSVGRGLEAEPTAICDPTCERVSSALSCAMWTVGRLPRREVGPGRSAPW